MITEAENTKGRSTHYNICESVVETYNDITAKSCQ